MEALTRSVLPIHFQTPGLIELPSGKTVNISVIIKAIPITGVLVFTNGHADTVLGGALTLNIDRNALEAGVALNKSPAPAIYVEEFWDASAASKTFNQIRDDNTPTDLTDYAGNEISALGLHFAVNRSTIPPNPTERQNRPTTFTFDPNNLFGTAAGSIGLGGVIRFRVDVDPPKNRVMLGDLTLEYHPNLEGASPGRSGWVIANHIGFDIDAFNLFDVTTSLNGNSLAIAGVLGLGAGFDHLSGIRDTRVGTFSFQTAVVPIPPATWLFLSGLTGLFWNGRTKNRRSS